MHIRSLVFASLSALALACQSPAHAMSPAAQTAPNAIAAAPAPATPLVGSPDFANIGQRILPSVVSIHVEQQAQQSSAESRGDNGPGFGEPGWFFHSFPGFGHQFRTPQQGPREGLGSGFVIDSESGLILTNYHVVDGADQIEVTVGTPEGPQQTVSAKVVGKAPDFDVALIRTEHKLDVPALSFGDSDKLRVGEWVMAVGNPFGLSQSMSVGIISGKHREDLNPSGHQGVYDFLQTDASINPGNSGGPLVDMNGHVIGMNTAISAQGSGIGFAIPASTLAHIFPSLKDKGGLSRSYIGVQIQSLTPDLAKSYGLPSTSGALVADVLPDSPAAKAGLQSGDVLTRFDGKSIDSSSTLPVLVSLTDSGKNVNVEFWRNGSKQTANVRLEQHPDKEASARGAQGHENGGFGLGLEPLTPQLRQQLGVDAKDGAVVGEVAPGSPAARAGLRQGDVITELGGKPVADAGQLATSLRGLSQGQIARLKVLRGDAKLFVAMAKS